MKIHSEETGDIEITKEELQELVEFVDWPSILSGTWDAVHDGDMTFEEAEKDSLLNLAFRFTGGVREKWLEELKKNLNRK